MKRRIQGLNETGAAAVAEVPEGMYLVRVDRVQYRWHPQKPFYVLRLSVLEPREWAGNTISGRLYCTSKALWKLGWFLRDFAYDPDLLGRDEADEKAMAGLRGIVKISRTVVNGRSLLNLDGFAPAASGRQCAPLLPRTHEARGGLMIYSYTQISHYLTCPRRYRYRYLDGWREKDTWAAMLFGRTFEQALGAYFRREDAAGVLFREWSACQKLELHYSNNDTWERMLEQGIMLLDRFCQDDRVRIRQPRRNLADQVHAIDRRRKRVRFLHRRDRNARWNWLSAGMENDW